MVSCLKCKWRQYLCPVDILMNTNDNTLPLNSHTYFYAQYWFFKWKTRRLESPSSWNKTSKMLCAGVSATDENQMLLLFGVSWILLNCFFFIFSIYFVSFLWKHCWIKYVLQLLFSFSASFQLALCRWTNGKWPTSVQALDVGNTNLFVPIGTPLCLSIRNIE